MFFASKQNRPVSPSILASMPTSSQGIHQILYPTLSDRHIPSGEVKHTGHSSSKHCFWGSTSDLCRIDFYCFPPFSTTHTLNPLSFIIFWISFRRISPGDDWTNITLSNVLPYQVFPLIFFLMALSFFIQEEGLLKRPGAIARASNGTIFYKVRPAGHPQE